MNCPLVETFIVPSLRQPVQEVMDNALKGHGTSNYELEFRTKSNEIRYLLVNTTTRRDAENNIVGVVFRTKSNEIQYLLVNATTRRDEENNIVGVVGFA